jgi:hypothetical protein
MSEIWIVGVDHEHNNASEGHRGPIIRCCYAIPQAPNLTFSPLNPAWAKECTRQEVLNWLTPPGQPLHTIYTAACVAQRRGWARGARVKPTPNGLFITTEGTSVSWDDLGNLHICIDAQRLLRDAW